MSIIRFVLVGLVVTSCADPASEAECQVDSDCDAAGVVCVDETCVPEGSDPSTPNPVVAPADPALPEAPEDLVVRPPTVGDTTGPVITIISPAAFAVVGGIVSLKASVQDTAGVEKSSVTFTIRGIEVVIADESDGVYEAYFDTQDVADVPYPAFDVRALDKKGNASAASVLFVVDNVPPIVDLEPPLLQMWEGGGPLGQRACSRAFDPVGKHALRSGLMVGVSEVPDSVRDRAQIDRAIFPRVRVEDRGSVNLESADNTDTWSLPVTSAGVQAESVKLYVLGPAAVAAGKKLVTGADGICTDIEPGVLPGAGASLAEEAAIHPMAPVTPAGTPDFSAPASGTQSWACHDFNPAGAVAPLLCPDTLRADDLTYWMSYSEQEQSAIYVYGGLNPGSVLLCSGAPFDVRNLVGSGPVCAAVRAVDALGNVGVSNPVLFCIDNRTVAERDEGVADPCAGFDGADARGQCTTGCTAPRFLPRIVRRMLGNADSLVPIEDDTGNNEPQVVDTAPPFVTISQPPLYQIIGTRLTIRASVTDGVGVHAGSVYAVIADTHVVPLEEVGANQFGTATPWGTTPVADVLYPSIEVYASDTSGNVGVGVTTFAVDVRAPIVDLAPTTMQMFQLAPDSEAGVMCSAPFSPLGESALQDGNFIVPAAFTQLSRFTGGVPGFDVLPRVRIEDRGNHEHWTSSTLVSDVDPGSVTLYFLDSLAIAAGLKLVQSSRGDGVCDRINPVVDPQAVDADESRPHLALAQRMTPAEVLGAVDYSTRPPAEGEEDPSATWACPVLAEEEIAPPDQLCPRTPGGTDVTYWLPSGMRSSAVYVLHGHTPGNPFLCAGAAFDTRNIAVSGKVCVAALASDVMGNVGVSNPIEICVDRRTDAVYAADRVAGRAGPCDAFAAAPGDAHADCSAGCVAPAFDAVDVRLEP